MAKEYSTFVRRLQAVGDAPGEFTGGWSDEVPYYIKHWAEREGHTSLLIVAAANEEMRLPPKEGEDV